MKCVRLMLFVGVIFVVIASYTFSQDAISLDYNPIVKTRNSSDPAVMVVHGQDGNDTIWLIASSDMPAQIIDKDEDGNPVYANYPLDKLFLYSTNQTLGTVGQWTDWGTVITENDFTWADHVNHLWASDIESRDGTYYLYITLIDPDGVQRIGIATASSPNGPYTALPNYLSDINPHPEKNQNIENPHVGYAYDPGIFRTLNGEYYMSYCDYGWPQGKIRIVKMNNDMISADPATDAQITFTNSADLPDDDNPDNGEGPGRFYMEAPDIFTVNSTGIDKYYLLFAAKVVGNHQEYIGYAMADPNKFENDPANCWEFKGWIMKNIDLNDPTDPVGNTEWTNHPSMAEFNGHYYLFYQIGHEIDHSKNRMVCVQEINFTDDGTIDRVSLSENHLSDNYVVTRDRNTALNETYSIDILGRKVSPRTIGIPGLFVVQDKKNQIHHLKIH